MSSYTEYGESYTLPVPGLNFKRTSSSTSSLLQLTCHFVKKPNQSHREAMWQITDIPN